MHYNMTVKLTPSTAIAAPLEQLHTKSTIPSVKGLVLSTSLCCFCKHDICLPALADLSDDNLFKNDFYSFIISTSASSTVTGTLIKINHDGSETPYIITNDDYGTFYPLGTLRADVWGFKLEWRKVATLLKFGRFKFNLKVETPFLRSIFDEDTPCFELQPWSCEAEHGTVRLETTQKGYIQDGFDFRGLQVPPSTSDFFWKQQIRTYGLLSRKTITETDSIPDTQFRERQIQTRTSRTWDLRLDWMRGVTTDFLTRELLLSNPILVSDFNQFNVDKYRNIELKYLETGDPEKQPNDHHEFYTVKFEDYKKATIKRHG